MSNAEDFKPASVLRAVMHAAGEAREIADRNKGPSPAYSEAARARSRALFWLAAKLQRSGEQPDPAKVLLDALEAIGALDAGGTMGGIAQSAITEYKRITGVAG